MLTDDSAIRALNRAMARHRQADQRAVVSGAPTAAGRGAAPCLGDIVIAYETLAREARRRGQAVRCIISPISRCMDFCTSSATITKSTPRPKRWKRLESEILARLGVPDPYATRDIDRWLTLTAMPDHDTSDSKSERRRSRASRATCRCRCRRRRARTARAGSRASARALFGWKHGSIRADLEDVLDADAPGESGFSPEESRDAQEHPGAARAPGRRRHGAARRHRRRAAGHRARRTGEGVRERRRIRAWWSTTTRSTTRSAWCTSAT